MKTVAALALTCRRMTLPFLLSTFLLFDLSVNGCSTNPATGERQLNLVGEQQEIAMGKQADQEVVASMGLYPDQALQKYVADLGAKLAASSERPNLPWKYQVIYDPVVNAFALPGGFIYVTRGILTYLNNEAELVGVLGHETGHVTAQHSVNQMSKQQLAQLGLGLGAILKPEWAEKFGQLAGAGLGILFLKFSRDDENEADKLGLRYMQKINEDPRQLANVMTMLDEVTKAAGGGDTPEWLQTHPNPGNRRQAIEEQIAAEGKSLAGATVNRDQYLNRLDGLVFGENPREGYFKGQTFYQPDMKFRFDFPSGWKTQNQKQAVAAISPNQDAMIVISLAKGNSAQAAASEFFSQQGLISQGTRSENIHGLSAVTGQFTAQTEQGNLAGQATFLAYNNTVFQILGYGAQQSWGGYASAVSSSIGSFDRLTDPTALAVQPMRMKIVTVPQAMTIEEFANRYPSAVPVETLALINGVEKGGRLSAGQKAKQVVGKKLQ
ncbi:peptidase M48 [bacterium]|nr:MAG: peptidase M48 [bacterium]